MAPIPYTSQKYFSLGDRTSSVSGGTSSKQYALNLAAKIYINYPEILRRIVGPKREANREWRRPYNEELHSLYHLPNIVRVSKVVARMEEGGNDFKL